MALTPRYGQDLGQSQKCVWVSRLMESQACFVDNWISNDIIN